MKKVKAIICLLTGAALLGYFLLGQGSARAAELVGFIARWQCVEIPAAVPFPPIDAFGDYRTSAFAGNVAQKESECTGVSFAKGFVSETSLYNKRRFVLQNLFEKSPVFGSFGNIIGKNITLSRDWIDCQTGVGFNDEFVASLVKGNWINSFIVRSSKWNIFVWEYVDGPRCVESGLLSDIKYVDVQLNGKAEFQRFRQYGLDWSEPRSIGGSNGFIGVSASYNYRNNSDGRSNINSNSGRLIPSSFAALIGVFLVIISAYFVNQGINRGNNWFLLVGFLPFFFGAYLFCGLSGIFGKLPHVTPLTIFNRSADYLVKGELLDQILAAGFKPILAFDDRDQVVKMWRERGIPCAQVADGNF